MAGQLGGQDNQGDFEGFEVGKGSQQHPGALLLGAYRNGKLHYFGHSELEVQRKRNTGLLILKTAVERKSERLFSRWATLARDH